MQHRDDHALLQRYVLATTEMRDRGHRIPTAAGGCIACRGVLVDPLLGLRPFPSAPTSRARFSLARKAAPSNLDRGLGRYSLDGCTPAPRLHAGCGACSYGHSPVEAGCFRKTGRQQFGLRRAARGLWVLQNRVN